MKLNSETVQVISALLFELSTELDLHYEDDQFAALSDTFAKMIPAAELLQQSGHEAPEAYTHVLGRYHRAQS